MRASQDMNIASGNKMTPTTLSKKILSAISLVALATTAIATTAQKYVFEFSNSGVAVAIDQHAPEYPRGSALRRQEGWVRLSYVVTPDGDAIDPIIVNSSGAEETEKLWALPSEWGHCRIFVLGDAPDTS